MPACCSLLTGADLTNNGADMKLNDDLDLFRANIHAKCSAYAWLLAIFIAIALCGWLTGQYLH